MKRGTQIRRKLLAVVPQGKSRRGNPEGFWFFLECGHVNWKFFTVHNSMDVFMAKVGQPPNVLCRNCSGGRRIDVTEKDIEMVDGLFPPKIRLLQKRIKEYRDGLKSLLEVTPKEFGNYRHDEAAYKYRHIKVVKKHSRLRDDPYREWPGSHKNVHAWYELEDGHAVGWNENPSLGWSFPVIKLKEKEK